MRTGIQIILRLPPPLLDRLNAEVAKPDPAHPWQKRSKNQYVIGLLDAALPTVAGAGAKPADGQLDIEDHIARKAKVRKVKRAAKVARKAKAKAKRAGKRGRKS
jgi:hypothetical protein